MSKVEILGIITNALFSKYDYIVKHYSLCDEVDNQSDYSPIVLSLNIEVYQNIHSTTVNISRKLWNRDSESDKSIYRNELDNCLKCIHVPIEQINCNNMLCNESVHINCITKFHDDIVLAAITDSDVIPETV